MTVMTAATPTTTDTSRSETFIGSSASNWVAVLRDSRPCRAAIARNEHVAGRGGDRILSGLRGILRDVRHRIVTGDRARHRGRPLGGYIKAGKQWFAASLRAVPELLAVEVESNTAHHHAPNNRLECCAAVMRQEHASSRADRDRLCVVRMNGQRSDLAFKTLC